MARSPNPGPGGSPFRVSELADLVPRLSELAPLLDLVVSTSRPDPERRWSGSGELGSVGNRMVDATAVARGSGDVAGSEAMRLGDLYGRAARVIAAVAQGRWSDAVELLIEQGLDDERRGRDREAEAWFLAAHRAARDRGEPRALEALRLAARAARQLGRLDDAAWRYEETWRSAAQLEMESDMIVAGIGRGNTAVDQGRWAEARDWYDRVLAVLGEAGAPRTERWQTLQNLAIVHRRSGSLAEARRFLEHAQEEGSRLGDPNAEVEVGNGWGQLLVAEGDPRGAELHFTRALALAGEPRAKVTIAVNLGEALLAQGKTLEAGERAREAESEALRGGIVGKLPEIYRLLAEVARSRGEREAFVLLEQALNLIRERDLPPFEEALTREAYGDLRIAEGDVGRGVSELRAAARIFDSLGIRESAERLLQRVAEVEDERSPGLRDAGDSALNDREVP